MFRLKPIALGFILFAGATQAFGQVAQTSQVADVKVVSNISAQLDQIAKRYYVSTQPGATVIVQKDGKTLLTGGYGLANVATNEKLTPDHVMRLGSITKQFTAVAIMQLVEQGKISLSDPISKYLDAYPESGKKVTVEHLLTHTSGIPSYTGKPGFIATVALDKTVSEMVDSFKNDALEFEPGSQWKYNNSGYFLLGAIIEKVSGMSYAKYVESALFIPLGMQDTAYENAERRKQLRAQGHSPRAGQFQPSDKISMTIPYAAGALVSNVRDLATWDAAINAGKILKPETWRRVFTPYKLSNGQTTTYGYGWNIGQLDGKPLYAHGGGIPGFATYALSLPEEKLFVAVLTNADSGLVSSEMVATRLASAALGTVIPEFKAVTLPSQVIDQYVGVYKIDETNRRYVTREGDKLVMSRTDGPRTVFQAYSETGFFKDNDSLLRVEFKKDGKGAVQEMTVYQRGASTTHEKLKEALPEAPKKYSMTNEVFDTLVGEYQINPNFILTVKRQGNRFLTQATGQREIEIFAVAADSFDAPDVGGNLKFEKNEQGKPTQLILTQNGRSIPAPRVK